MSSMMELIQELWYLARELVSDEYDQALYRLADEVPMTIHEYPTGMPAWTWTVPEKWTCRQAYLETLDGRRIIDRNEHPLHVVSYSLPFEGVVSREELLDHLHVHPDNPDWIPFVFKYYQRDWGLCLPGSVRDLLDEDRYRVVIDTVFEPGTLKVGEVIVPGELEESFMLAAHLCHPAMVNDDLSGVVVGLDAMRQLLAGPKPRYTYRFLVLPETIGSVAYLSQNEDLIPTMAGGLFLEMLGNDSGLALQQSFQPESQADRALIAGLRGAVPDAYVGPYRTIINNDERQFNAPGVRVPMLSLSRVERPELTESMYRPYPEYHSSADTPEIVSQARLEDGRQAVLVMLAAFDRNEYVVNRFKGEVFASGHGIWIDYHTNPEGHRNLFQIMERCDGSRTMADIALELGISFQAVWEIVSRFVEKDLAAFSRIPQPTDPPRRAGLNRNLI
jgi:aminopeptidase-like protein